MLSVFADQFPLKEMPSIHHNKLKILPEWFQKFTQIESLDLSFNELMDLAAETISKLIGDNQNLSKIKSFLFILFIVFFLLQK